MDYIVIGLAVLQMLTPSYQMTIKPLDDTLIPILDPLDEQMQSRIGRLQEYMQHKIMEQNRALGYLLQLGQTNEVLMKKLMRHCRPYKATLKPDKVEIFLPSRRSDNNDKTINEEENTKNRDKRNKLDEDTPIISMIKYGENFPKLGKLILDVISNEFSHQLQPISKPISSTEIRAM